MDYFSTKIETLKSCGETSAVRVDVGEAPDIGACAILYQAKGREDRSMMDDPLALMTIGQTATGQIGELLMITAAPSPASAVGSGLFPGMECLSKEPSKAPLLHIAGDHKKLTLVLCLLNGDISLDKRAKKSMDKVLRHFLRAQLRVIVFETASMEESDELSAAGVMGFPSVLVYWNSALVMKKVGLLGVEEMIAAIHNVIP